MLGLTMFISAGKEVNIDEELIEEDISTGQIESDRIMDCEER